MTEAVIIFNRPREQKSTQFPSRGHAPDSFLRAQMTEARTSIGCSSRHQFRFDLSRGNGCAVSMRSLMPEAGSIIHHQIPGSYLEHRSPSIPDPSSIPQIILARSFTHPHRSPHPQSPHPHRFLAASSIPHSSSPIHFFRHFSSTS